MGRDLEGWLDQGEVPEADWATHLVGLAARGDLGHVAPDWFLDLPALTQPYACKSLACTPGKRGPRTRSCCADLEVHVTADERAAIEHALPEIEAHLAAVDPRWERGAPERFDGPALRRPGGRCVFAADGPRGLRCGLHVVEDATGRPRGALKPVPCQLFPLVVIAIDDERKLLTAVHRRTARRLDLSSSKLYPCLRGDERSALFRSQRDTIVGLLGADVYAGIKSAVRSWRARG